jgi:hypothetical protein
VHHAKPRASCIFGPSLLPGVVWCGVAWLDEYLRVACCESVAWPLNRQRTSTQRRAEHQTTSSVHQRTTHTAMQRTTTRVGHRCAREGASGARRIDRSGASCVRRVTFFRSLTTPPQRTPHTTTVVWAEHGVRSACTLVYHRVVSQSVRCGALPSADGRDHSGPASALRPRND